MPIIAKQTLGNRKDVNGQIAKQTPTCKVGHGLGRRISLTGYSQKVNNYQNYKLREEGATTWLNGNGPNIAVQKKHIKNLGIDVNNFYGGPVITSRPKLSTQRRLRTETNAPEGDINNMVTQQIYWVDYKVSKFHKIMNPEIVRPIDKFTLDNLRKCPQRVRDSGNSRVHKRYEKKLSKPINSTTNRRTVVRMSEENVEYDTITLCDFGEITPRNYPEETDSEKWYSSDPDSDDTIIESSHIDDNISTSEEENVQNGTGYESDISLEETLLTAEYNRPIYNIKPVDSDIFTLEKGELHSRRKKEAVILLEGERPLLAKKVITLSDKEDSDIFTPENEDVQGRMEYESEEEPQCSEKEFTAENKRPKYNTKPVYSYIFISENGELHSRKKEVVILLEGEGPLLVKKVITVSNKEDSDIFTPEDEDVQGRMEYESEGEPQCSEKEFTAEYKRPKYNIKPVYSDIFTSENGELHSSRKKEVVILLEGKGTLFAKSVITLSDNEDTDSFSSEEGFQSEGHEASELTINSEEDESLLAENDFILDNMNLKNDAQNGKGIEIIDTSLRDDNSNWELRQPSMITFDVTTSCCDDSQLWQFLLRTYKKLMNNGKLPWLGSRPRASILEFNSPSERHCYASFLLYVFSGLGNIRPATLVRIDIRYSPYAEENPSPYFDKRAFDLEQARLVKLMKKAMEVDRINLMRAKRDKLLINYVKRIRIFLAHEKVENKRFCCTKKKRRSNLMMRMILRIHPLIIICSVIVISASFLVYHELYFERPKPLTLWQSFLLCFGI
ncbi:uncharacterized protein LOC26534570 [Drosophila yakuba]|uniref:Uncharacterized protein n=1 Tax=Drosophila yakuba TaxID=7245 RepID=A0A0R1DTW6_DROYA|nr:uncharacterized protein LOC26534570 [Drosophila yakuba]KRJ98134.1 uncharacterized protein Dyak_GE27389 [Drosophila yakuba]